MSILISLNFFLIMRLLSIKMIMYIICIYHDVLSFDFDKFWVFVVFWGVKETSAYGRIDMAFSRLGFLK